MQKWLESIDFADYCPKFLAAGYDHEDNIKYLSEEDLNHIGGIKPGHRQRILSSAREFAQASGEGTASKEKVQKTGYQRVKVQVHHCPKSFL